jgi:hypothetical protein
MPRPPGIHQQHQAQLEAVEALTAAERAAAERAEHLLDGPGRSPASRAL